MNDEESGPARRHPAQLPPSPVFRLRNARLGLPGATSPLLDVEEFTLLPGERVVITGPSGAGKSLLLSMVTGRWALGLEFTGTRTPGSPRIGYIPQRGQDALHPLLPLGRQLRKATGASAQQVRDTLQAAGLSDPQLLARRPAELSGGQAQRAAIALAVLSQAPVILADEPTSALDHHSRDLILELLGNVLGQRQTLVLVTHDPAAAQALATRHLVLDSGKIASTTAPRLERVPA
ncbi:ATP-binding cassette domain-containing protein [Glutamicibacter sp.]|uniref:ATP-binding cassette domain-containing protein n=1 Tax=Glutamicibacter sp. TaxID=1931995 RepID=UPI003D6A0714